MLLRRFFTLLLALTPAAAAPTWELVGTTDGVTSYKLPPDADGVVHFKGDVIIAARPADVAAAMDDNSTAAEWMPLVVERRNLKVLSPTDHIEYTHMGMPWPATDRYFLDESTMEALPGGSYRFTVESVANPDPAWLKPDLVLAIFRKSVAVLTPDAGGRRTHLVFEVHSAAGGYLPQWLVAMAQRSWPHDFAVGLTKQLEKRGKLTERHDGEAGDHGD